MLFLTGIERQFIVLGPRTIFEWTRKGSLTKGLYFEGTGVSLELRENEIALQTNH